MENLTKEEMMILKYFKEGLNFKEIKEKYGLTLYTNDERVNSLYDKFNATNRLELIKKYDKMELE